MSSNLFNDRFYGNRESAWHKLGYVSQADNTAQEVLGIIGSYWIEKRPVTILLNGANQETGDFALVRSAVPDDPKELVLGFCSEHYNIVQPDTIGQLFDDNVKQAVETLGMLGNGEKLFLTWKMPGFDVLGDYVSTYGFVAAGFDGVFGTSLSLVTVRVVCSNTFAVAINQSLNKTDKSNGKGRVYTGHHNSDNVARDLGIWMEHVQIKAIEKRLSTQENFVRMANVSVDNTATLADLLFKIYPDPETLPVDYPDRLKSEKQNKIDDLAEKAKNDRTLVESLFNGEGTGINATAWGLFNAVTEYENWGRDTRKPAEYSILMGNRANTMAKAYNIINQWSGSKK